MISILQGSIIPYIQGISWMWAPDPNVGPRHGKSRNIFALFLVGIY